MNLTIVDVETSTPDITKPDMSLDTARCKLDLIGAIKDKECIITPYNGVFPQHFFKGHDLCGHNLKFDYRVLHHKGIQLSVDQCAHDTLVMAVASISKVPENYLEQYEAKRRELNKALPKGQSYRPAKKHSLKILAPYFLGVSPFYENPATTNDPEYLRKDLEYTKGLFEHFSQSLKTEEVWSFYEEKLMPWQRMTLEMELDGIAVDLEALRELKAKAEHGAITSLAKLRDAWKKVEEQWQAKCHHELRTKYQDLTMKAAAKIKAKDENERQVKQGKIIERYQELENKAVEKIEPFNYASPSQLLWAFKDVLKYPTVNLEGDETTGASILEMLAAKGKEDIKALLEYKANYKLAHAYFPSYEERMLNNRIHASFNLHGAKTGRLSSSDPNLQQIPPDLKKLFIPAPGNVFVSQDLSAIEPVLMAYYTEDKNLCDIFIKNKDFHGYCATALFPAAGLLPDWVKPEDVKKQYPNIRQAAKQVDLSLAYGSSKNRLFTTLTLHGMQVDEKQCMRMVYSYRDRFKDLWEFKLMLDAELLAGNYVENLFGRRFKIENKDDVYMQGFNRLIQGSASDLLMQGALKTLTELGKKGIEARPRLAVHDNFVIECKEADGKYVYDTLEKNLTSFVLNTKHGRIPLKVEGTYGRSWKC